MERVRPDPVLSADGTNGGPSLASSPVGQNSKYAPDSADNDDSAAASSKVAASPLANLKRVAPAVSSTDGEGRMASREVPRARVMKRSMTLGSLSFGSSGHVASPGGDSDTSAGGVLSPASRAMGGLRRQGTLSALSVITKKTSRLTVKVSEDFKRHQKVIAKQLRQRDQDRVWVIDPRESFLLSAWDVITTSALIYTALLTPCTHAGGEGRVEPRTGPALFCAVLRCLPRSA